MNKFSKYVGLDVHQETIAVALADTAGEVRYMGDIFFNPLTGPVEFVPPSCIFCGEVAGIAVVLVSETAAGGAVLAMFGAPPFIPLWVGPAVDGARPAPAVLPVSSALATVTTLPTSAANNHFFVGFRMIISLAIGASLALDASMAHRPRFLIPAWRVSKMLS
jgi:hypothetical protein